MIAWMKEALNGGVHDRESHNNKAEIAEMNVIIRELAWCAFISIGTESRSDSGSGDESLMAF